jgi:hypothetical protein
MRAILLVAALAACGPMPAPSPASARADSISLERTLCFSNCAAYRVSLARDGTVRFQSRNPGDTTTATDRIDPAAFDALVREARRIGFWSFPAVILDNREFCGSPTTDGASATVTIHGPAGTRAVDNYSGCDRSERLAELRRFEDRIDSVAGSSRWARPWFGHRSPPAGPSAENSPP